ncbi:MAG: enoyl-CoA hydratase/isomerase family protein, partial [Eubacterium sp.]|nr:enoyl-CoA hydratase/isomerase family protein [Eubacterium sp.]
MKEYTCMTFEKKDRVAVITKTNEHQGFCMSQELLVEEIRALRDAAEDDDVRVIVITSISGIHQGAYAVSKYVMENATPMQVREVIAKGHELGRLIETIEKPIIGVVKKEAVGGGFETLQPCDFIICSEDAKFQQPEAESGTIAGWGGILRLTRMIGWRNAQRMLLACEPVYGKEAAEIGIATRAVSAQEVDATVDELCNRLKRYPAQSLAYTKTDMHKAWEMDLRSAMDWEIQALSVLMAEGLHRDSIP